MPKVKPLVSVIIPTFNRNLPLVNTLKCVLANNYPSFEVIVVDQSTEKFSEKEKYLYSIKKRIQFYYLNRPNAAKARNLGLIKAKGEIILFLDDDVEFEEDLINNHVKNYNQEKVGAVTGRVVTEGQTEEPECSNTGRITFLGKFTDGFSSKIRQEIQTVITCNASWRKSVLDQIGVFDENFTGPIREDSDLSLRTLKIGYKIIFDPAAEVIHKKADRGGFRKSEGRLRWYRGFFKNETYFFLKHFPYYLWPIVLMTRWQWIVKCMFGRNVSFTTIIAPFQGIWEGLSAYRRYQDENRN